MRANQKKLLAFILCIYISLAITVSYIFLIEHMNHQCSGQDCPICIEMQMCAHILSFGAAVAITVCGFYFKHTDCFLKKVSVVWCLVFHTLILDKVRMDD